MKQEPIKISEYQRHMAKKFIRVFEDIPEERWCCNTFHNKDKTKFCALGHLGVTGKESHPFLTEDASQLNRMVGEIYHCGVGWINDGMEMRRFPGKTAKSRILGALRRIVEL